MTYTPTKWKKGDVVTSVGLNNIEDELVELDSAKQDGGVGWFEKESILDVTIPVADWTSSFDFYKAEVTLPEDPQQGQEYFLIIDGVKYFCECTTYEGGWAIWAISVPSLIEKYEDDPVCVCIYTEPTADVHVELIRVTPHKIDRHLVDGPLIVDADNSFQIDSTLNKTYAEIDSAIKAGRNIILRYVSYPDTRTVFEFASLFYVGPGADNYYVVVNYTDWDGNSSLVYFISSTTDGVLTAQTPPQ